MPMTAERGDVRVLIVLVAIGIVFLSGCGIVSIEPLNGPSTAEEDAGSDTGETAHDATGDDTAEEGGQRRPITIAIGGDVHAENQVAELLESGGNPLDGLGGTLRAADVAIVNLETAVGTSGTPAPKQFAFQAPATLLDALAAAGVDVVTLANNHALDYGVDGLLETIDRAEAAGLEVVGAGRDASEAYAPHYVDVEGRRVGIVGLTRVFPVPEWAASSDRPGMASAYEPGLPLAIAAIEEARRESDWVVVTVHWGQERAPCPDDVQTQLARTFVDAGADVVAGHHPHVLQGVQRVDDAVVAYSLGNFVWYASTEESRTTGVFTVELTEDAEPAWGLVPALIDDTGSPQPTVGDQAQSGRILGLVSDRSPGGAACAGTAWP
jgi:poly-gamma-glutamate capsule biosynthesis protein CapA/YwtB (metallophosphatase superfamily)